MKPTSTVMALEGGVSALLFGKVSESDRKFGLRVLGRLDDPLVGKSADLHRFVDSPHPLAGMMVASGPLAIFWQRTDGLTKVVYRYTGWELRLETVAELIRHPHRRSFIITDLAQLSGRFGRRPLRGSLSTGRVKLPTAGPLEQDLAEVYALHLEARRRISGA